MPFSLMMPGGILADMSIIIIISIVTTVCGDSSTLFLVPNITKENLHPNTYQAGRGLNDSLNRKFIFYLNIN